MIDSNFKPILIEINTNPAITLGKLFFFIIRDFLKTFNFLKVKKNEFYLKKLRQNRHLNS